MKEIVYRCIETYLNLNVRNVPIDYLNFHDFVFCIKKNFPLLKRVYESPEAIRRLFQDTCDIIKGLYKKRERRIKIKFEYIDDYYTLLSELIHSQSITQYHKEIELWISEGITHYLAKILSEKCNIEYTGTGYERFFVVWKRIHHKHQDSIIDIFKSILFPFDIQITIRLLQEILPYEEDDILTITFEEIKNKMGIK